MKGELLNRKIVPVLAFIFVMMQVQAQTFSWASYVRSTHYPIGSSYYTQTITTGTTSTTVYADIESYGNAGGALNNATFVSSSPLYVTSDAVGGCGTSNSFQSGLALYCDWSDYGTAASNATTQWPYVLVTLDFTGGTNGVCGPLNFSIYDINSDASTQTFLDWVEVSAYASSGAYIVPSISSGTQKCNYNMGTYTNPASPGPLKYNGSGSCTCWPDYITVGAAGTVIGKLVIKYYPDHSGSYWNTSPRNPRSQYIIISNITTGGVGCAGIVLPVELLSYEGICNGDQKTLHWSTATEKENDHFTIERSKDGWNFEELAKVKGAGNSQKTIHYVHNFKEEDASYKYYRLKQTDHNGYTQTLKMLYLDCVDKFDKVELLPNPAANQARLRFDSPGASKVLISVRDVAGHEVRSFEHTAEAGENAADLDLSELVPGVYFISVADQVSLARPQVIKFIKQ